MTGTATGWPGQATQPRQLMGVPTTDTDDVTYDQFAVADLRGKDQ